jgi:hypothetical protein
MELRPMRSSRHPEREQTPTSRRGEDAPAERTSAESSSIQLSSIEHFLCDYAPVDRPPTPATSRR